MQKIIIDNLLPVVFSDKQEIKSELWRQNIVFEKGKNYLVSAESGAGKSSLCSYVYGFRTDYEGTITFDDRNVSALNVRDWCQVRTHQLAYLPQELRLFYELTAFENIALKNNLTKFKTNEEIEHLFDVLGIADKMKSVVGRLSIGQQQRVAFIRTLCQPCDFFLLDEPVSHLDEKNNRIIGSLVEEEASRQGAGIISTSVGNKLILNVDKELKL